MTDRRILVTGASGYIGGRLVPLLLNQDRMNCVHRTPMKASFFVGTALLL